MRPLAGLLTVVVIASIVAAAVGLFRGSYTETVPITVISQRAGLVMNPDAKVKMHGVQIGAVSSINERADGTAVLHLAMNPSALHLIPSNVLVHIESSTVFGAKFVQLLAPQDPSPQALQPGQSLAAGNVTVELNTIFQQLTTVLSAIEPEKLSETLGAISKAFNGRGEKFGQSLADVDALLAKMEPSLPTLSHEFAAAPAVLNAYAAAAPDLVKTIANTTRISQTIVEEQQDLDALLLSAIGLADAGNDVVGGNSAAVTDVFHLLVPTTNLLNQYHEALNCSVGGLLTLAAEPPPPDPGVELSVGLTLGVERYRYPSSLPKVAAKGGPHCMGLPKIPYGSRAPFLVADTGANPWQYGNQGILLNADALKQALFGPIDGPPRNTPQMGQPG